jgi:hypothetical protein
MIRIAMICNAASTRARSTAQCGPFDHFQQIAMAFADNLRQLPSVAHLKALDLIDGSEQVVATIENKPGQAGSLALYAALASKHDGAITPEAAQEGLDLYAEHTLDANSHPGKHPNIDRLIAIIATGQALKVQLQAA